MRSGKKSGIAAPPADPATAQSHHLVSEFVNQRLSLTRKDGRFYTAAGDFSILNGRLGLIADCPRLAEAPARQGMRIAELRTKTNLPGSRSLWAAFNER